MKQIKPGEYLTATCRYCKAKATFRSTHLNGTDRFSCSKHTRELKEAENQAIRDSDHMSEGDHQSWGRL